MDHYGVNNNIYGGLLLLCNMCETENILMLSALTCFTNILLNDYTTA